MKRGNMRRSFLTLALAATALAWGSGSSQAYLGAPGEVIGPGDLADYLSNPNWAYSPPLRKFVDGLPGVPGATTYNSDTVDANLYNADGTNKLGQMLTVAIPDIVTYPGSDYYEIALQQYAEHMHSDLAGLTTQRGYVQLNNGTDTSACADPITLPVDDPGACAPGDNIVAPMPGPHHLGPIIIAQKDRPVRVKFVNQLDPGAGGDLFIPVDTSIMGSGPYVIDYDPVTKEPIAQTPERKFVDSRATLHLHGGNTPWISDGTPHQWIAPAGADDVYPRGVSSKNVPDMDDPGAGASTFYWTNQQSSRLMFYHDHAWGITRLNVYVGEAAGYVIQEPVEEELIGLGIIPEDFIPLIIEDKTFVDPATIALTDPTWAWGTAPWDGTPGAAMTPVAGDLWWPHVYMSAENPFDITGIAPMGRWAYGPYFWPPTTNIPYPPVPNPYYDPACDVNGLEASTPGLVVYNGIGYCQPPEIPGTPNPSWGAEAFMDTPVINGTAYPVLKIDPKAYRLRILNAAHDRFYNLQFYEAVTAPGAVDCLPGKTCADNSEIRYVPALDYTAMTAADPQWPSVGANLQPDTWPMDGRTGGAPDWNTVGPPWIQIGTESGFMAKPVILENNPVIWNTDVTTFNAGNVTGGTLILAPAERADVIVDFSAYAGKTLILYNDAPAPFPALDPHYDYFTGAEDMTDAGGLPPTPVGLGPNIRTIMQIQVADITPAPAYDVVALQDVFATGTANGGAITTSYAPSSLFQAAQHPIVVGQAARPDLGFAGYDGIYDTNPTFPTNYPNWGVSRISDNYIGFEDVTGAVQSVYMEPKAIQDEMGETYDDYGRLSAKLGLEMSFTTAGVQTFVLQNYVDPSTEILAEEGVQIWKVTHNGVDTHPLHFHLYDVQVINRVGWDGFIRFPFPNELGWKDTVRISPLEDTIIALRPTTPRVPFGVPESIRPLNPMEPLGSTNGFTTLDPLTGQPRDPIVTNEMTNFDWEYVIHCHILSHEENDMMRTVVYGFVEQPVPMVTNVNATGAGTITVTWDDPVPVDYANLATFGNHANEIGFVILRSANNGLFKPVAYALANDTQYVETPPAGPTYRYQVVAYNALGYSPTAIDHIGTFNNGTWLLDSNQTPGWQTSDSTVTLGTTGDTAVIGDWDGDGVKENGVFLDGVWSLDTNGIPGWQADDTTMILGEAGDIPVVGDWDGDGSDNLGVFRGNGWWYLDSNGTPGWQGPASDTRVQLGQTGDTPVVGDWDGSGNTNIGVYRAGWWFLDSNGVIGWQGPASDTKVQLGIASDTPVVGDWTASGITHIGVYRAGWWYLDTNGVVGWQGPAADTRVQLGLPDDIPVVGDWTSVGKTSIGVFRNGDWYLDTNGTIGWQGLAQDSMLSLGAAGQKPVVGNW